MRGPVPNPLAGATRWEIFGRGHRESVGTGHLSQGLESPLADHARGRQPDPPRRCRSPSTLSARRADDRRPLPPRRPRAVYRFSGR